MLNPGLKSIRCHDLWSSREVKRRGSLFFNYILSFVVPLELYTHCAITSTVPHTLHASSQWLCAGHLHLSSCHPAPLWNSVYRFDFVQATDLLQAFPSMLTLLFPSHIATPKLKKKKTFRACKIRSVVTYNSSYIPHFAQFKVAQWPEGRALHTRRNLELFRGLPTWLEIAPDAYKIWYRRIKGGCGNGHSIRQCSITVYSHV